jgi:hypothetical protein
MNVLKLTSYLYFDEALKQATGCWRKPKLVFFDFFIKADSEKLAMFISVIESALSGFVVISFLMDDYFCLSLGNVRRSWKKF